ncbi:MAG: YidC/Oxa1 family membrane protein insertase [Clostridia bacterium]|nr:YidC/Oxa1 family membrane protein insertase [Clostridia bacterium]
MEFFNFLAVAIDAFDPVQNIVKLDWIGNIIKWLIESCNSIGIGIILFTLILKLITLPFDIISRVSTKKSSVMMEKMRPELERLQRQYANNKDLYQRKMQDLYKKNGYSPFSACLPTILNLVIFIIVIGQFSTYSNYANYGVFCNMSVAYEQAIENYNQNTNTETIIFDETDQKKYLNLELFLNSDHAYANEFKAYGLTVDFTQSKIKPTVDFDETNQTALKRIYEEIAKGTEAIFANPYFVTNNPEEVANAHIWYDEASREYKFGGLAKENFTTYLGNAILEAYANLYVNDVIKFAGSQAAAEVFRNTELSFLWVKNIWSQDLPWEHPVKATFKEYAIVKSSGCFATCSASCSGADNSVSDLTEDHYNALTRCLTEEKEQPNGYLILVLLSIGVMLVSQVIAQKQNKTQTELGSVDGENGSAAQSQKMMMWMMPIMFGFFSFMYTASFSIYIIVSSLFSLLANFIINKLVDLKFARIAEKEAHELELRRTGRIKEINNKKDKNDKSKK